MIINVKFTNTDKTTKYTVDEKENINVLCEKIKNELEIDSLKLIYSGKILKVDKSWIDYNINNNYTIIAFYKNNNTSNNKNPINNSNNNSNNSNNNCNNNSNLNNNPFANIDISMFNLPNLNNLQNNIPNPTPQNGIDGIPSILPNILNTNSSNTNSSNTNSSNTNSSNTNSNMQNIFNSSYQQLNNNPELRNELNNIVNNLSNNIFSNMMNNLSSGSVSSMNNILENTFNTPELQNSLRNLRNTYSEEIGSISNEFRSNFSNESLNNLANIGNFSNLFQNLNLNNQQNLNLNNPVTTEDEETYKSQLEVLKNMGFYNNTHNINALKYTNGNTEEAVNIILNNSL